MQNKRLITASIVTYNDTEKALNAISSLRENTKNSELKVFVFDNSTASVDLKITTEADTYFKTTENLGFGAAHNLILGYPMGEYHAVINPDITVSSDVLSYLADILQKNPDIAMITPKILNSDGTEQKLPKRNPTFKYMFLGRLSSLGGIFKKIRDDYTRANEVFTDITDIDFCSGCFFMIRSDILKEIGGFDERYFMYLEDADLTRKVKKYGRVVFCPEISVTHEWERGSAKNLKLLFIHLSSFFKYRRKWKNELR